MELIRGQHNLKPQHHGCVATLGSFDGVHLGHQYVIEQLLDCAQQQQLPAVLITSEPLPREFFQPANAPPRLTRLREKLTILSGLGLQRVFCSCFNAEFANMSAETFITDILHQGLGIKHIVLGDDTRFGQGRRGDMAMLQRFGNQYGFTVAAQSTRLLAGERVSSTRIRTALGAGDMLAASQLLGRDYHMSGRVSHGDKRGRELGYPTANIHLNRRQTPLMGVFAVEVAGLAAQKLPGVASLGVRPTFGPGQCLLEVHLFDFDRSIYGEYVDVYFKHKLREEMRFDSVETLVAQIHQDAEQAQQFFNKG